MAGEYIEFNNLTQPAINDTNLNLMQQLIKQDIQGAVSGDTLPIGTIVPFGSNTIPENWLLCDGSAVSRTTYQTLFNTIGTTYGAGDGFTTFNLPDLRGRVSVGKSSDTEFDTLGETGGEKKHILTIDEMPSHTHELYAGAGGSTQFPAYASKDNGNTGAEEISGYSTVPKYKGNNQPHNILQPYIVTNYIIKAYQTAGIVSNVIDNLNSSSATDALSAKQGKLLGQYSTSEIVVGTWVNGKPLYRKVYDLGNLPNTGNKDVATGLTDVMVQNIYGRAYNPVSTNVITLPYVAIEMQAMVSLAFNNNNIRVVAGSDRSNLTGYAVLEYTKTTD
jgi:microcystin-dependent protein